ncbi:MAG: hypothetical protein KatS3mg087_1056 [Patescibacteria group bacterium]|nr:MAG: hypothetical protein KatS3mg087_1056 [Patescibacteria group bacterium]
MGTRSLIKAILADDPLDTTVAARVALARIKKESQIMLKRGGATESMVAFFEKINNICAEYDDELDKLSVSDVARIIDKTRKQLVKEFAAGNKKKTETSDLEIAIQHDLEHARAQKEESALQFLVSMFQDVQKQRIALMNRMSAWLKNKMNAFPFELSLRLKTQIEDIEELLKPRICVELSKHPAGMFLAGIAGVGPIIGARIVSLIPMDSELNFSNYSKLRKFAGMAPGFDKRVKGVKCSYSPKLRTALHVLWQIWLKLDARGVLPERHYMAVYRKWLEHYQAHKPDWSKMHCSMAAKRKCLDPFLCNLWEYWRKTQGWEARPLYVHERLGHTSKYNIEDFWDKELAEKRIVDWRKGKSN